MALTIVAPPDAPATLVTLIGSYSRTMTLANIILDLSQASGTGSSSIVIYQSSSFQLSNITIINVPHYSPSAIFEIRSNSMVTVSGLQISQASVQTVLFAQMVGNMLPSSSYWSGNIYAFAFFLFPQIEATVTNNSFIDNFVSYNRD